MSQPAHIQELLQKVTSQRASEEDLGTLMQWVREDDSKERTRWMQQYLDAGNTATAPAGSQYWDEICRKVLNADRTVQTTPVHFLKAPWLRYAAILLLIAGIWWLSHPGRRTPEDTLTDMTRPGSLASPNNDISPGTTKATLVLADGSTILLDSAANGNLANQGTTKIVKPEDGKLAYQQGNASAEIGYNTITTPRGGQYQIVLPDGTKVWLNAASSIKFPTAFGKDRTIEVTGEAYLEVAADKVKPFIATTPQSTIHVLGTAFNINAYTEESSEKISLFEGSVKISNTLLHPGEAYTNGKLTKTNLDQDLAWKNGFFNFQNKPFAEIMRQLARWYDIDVVYSGAIPTIQLEGEMSRNMPLSFMLLSLKQLQVNYKMEGRTLVILP